jgi:hypothetical protein
MSLEKFDARGEIVTQGQGVLTELVGALCGGYCGTAAVRRNAAHFHQQRLPEKTSMQRLVPGSRARQLHCFKAGRFAQARLSPVRSAIRLRQSLDAIL